MKICTVEQHRSRIKNINEAEKSLKKYLRRQRIHDYLFGQDTYYMGDYPAKYVIEPTEYDYNVLKDMAENGVQLIQIHEDWNDSARLYGADKFSTWDPEGLKHFVSLAHSFGIKVIPYVSSGYFHIYDPDFRKEFAQTERYCMNALHFKYIRCSAGSAEWRSYVLPRTLDILNSYGFDGIYNDWGTDSNYIIKKQLQKPGLGYYDPEIEDLLSIIYGEVKKRGGVYKLHCDLDSPAPCLDKVYDYLWIGEWVKELKIGVGKTYEDFVVPCPDFARSVNGSMESHFVRSIPFLQFPLLMRGRPLTANHLDLPHVTYYGEEFEGSDAWFIRRARKYLDENPDGPHIYSLWSSLGHDDEYYELWKKYQKLYAPMVEEASVAYLEIRECDDILSQLPEKVIASMFVNEDRYLVVSNLSEQAYTLQLKDVWVDRETGAQGHQFVIQPDKALFLRLK